ncbi:MAG: NTP transferase domain-containing protein [Acidobacteriota bacterium]
MSKDLVILAAGMGQRFGGLKQLAPVGRHGEAIMDYIVRDAIEAGFDRVVLVIRRAIEVPVRAHVERGFGRRIEVEYALQEPPPSADPNAEPRRKPWGTVHAVLASRAVVSDRFAVANADDLYGRRALATSGRFLDALQPSSTPTWGLVGYRADATLPPSGAVSRSVLRVSQGRLCSIDEISAMRRHPRGACWNDGDDLVTIDGATPVSMNLWAFSKPVYDHLADRFERFLSQRPSPEAELLLPVTIGELIDRRQAEVRVLETASRWCGITAGSDIEWVRARIADRVAEGVYEAPLWG